MISRLVIVPARGGSKRIKNKNIKIFCNKPMIQHSLKTIEKVNCLKKFMFQLNQKKFTAK